MPQEGLPLWKALAATDLTEDEVLVNQEWRQRFPEVYEQLDELMGSPPPEWDKVWIPGPMLVETGGKTQLLFATSDSWLMSTVDTIGIFAGYAEIPALAALEEYGPEPVFEAADKASCCMNESDGMNCRRLR